jgi:hypothetical protein
MPKNRFYIDSDKEHEAIHFANEVVFTATQKVGPPRISRGTITVGTFILRIIIPVVLRIFNM